MTPYDVTFRFKTGAHPNQRAHSMTQLEAPVAPLGRGSSPKTRPHSRGRCRVLGARPGHAPARGGDRRLRDPRTLERCRRHVARQHLPWLRLRRPLPPLLVLLRAESRLEPHLLRAARDLRVHPPHGERAGRPRLRALRPRRSELALERGATALGNRDLGRRFHCVVPGLGHGAAQRTGLAEGPGARQLRGQDLPLDRVGPRP